MNYIYKNIDITIKKLQQMLMKKNSYSLTIDTRNARTNQLTGDDKIARFTEAENFAAAIWGIEDGTKELLGARADDSVAKTQLYRQIAQQGYCTLSEVENDLANKHTLNTVDVFMIGAGIMSDLVTEGLELRRTEDARKKRASTSEKVSNKTER